MYDLLMVEISDGSINKKIPLSIKLIGSSFLLVALHYLDVL